MDKLYKKGEFNEKEYLNQTQFGNYLGVSAYGFGKVLDAAGLRNPNTKKPTAEAHEKDLVIGSPIMGPDGEWRTHYLWHTERTKAILTNYGAKFRNDDDVIKDRMVDTFIWSIMKSSEDLIADETNENFNISHENCAKRIDLVCSKWCAMKQYSVDIVNRVMVEMEKREEKNQIKYGAFKYFLDHPLVRTIKVMEILDSLDDDK